MFAHAKMTEYQKMAILYLSSFIACILGIIPVSSMAVIVIGIQFIYSEYLNEDSMKIKIITKIRYKILDFLFQFFINYATWMFLISIVLCSYDSEKYKYFLWTIAAEINFLLIQYMISNKFEIKSFTKIMQVIGDHPINCMPSNIQNEMFTILSDMEDKSFFIRANTYNIISMEFLKYKFDRTKTTLNIKDKISIVKKYVRCSKNIRGYSTIEMQLLRTIALERGYPCVFRRKIFEIFYSKIFLTSLRDYYEQNQIANWWNFKQYIIWLYYYCVPITVDDCLYRCII